MEFKKGDKIIRLSNGELLTINVDCLFHPDLFVSLQKYRIMKIKKIKNKIRKRKNSLY